MITAIVMVEVDAESINDAAQRIADLPGVDQVYSCAGDVDLIVVSQLRDHAELAELVPGHISRVPGVKRTVTHIAFRSFAKRDGEDAFSIGLEGA
ncbi:Lrp/AsnC family transcriptional regulator [Nakamurella antarctica]|uniref:Lrp/AsnC family transcriptional regulator n=1 Tax=Nakamurella antarctica TaxID=1902245 RepID=A0A3G8ZKK2_9ACTN|nr:Lrp/AsnC ligand binding domain-containing protein [Nakamurella antarctica]AZI57783.1 Lrp/AsnC family transcriptional regulator [Nakamurella antarctica]